MRPFINLVYSCSLQALHKKLLMGETCQSGKNSEDLVTDRYWNGDHEIVHAVWTLVRMCGSDDADSVRALASDFISRVSLLDSFTSYFFITGSCNWACDIISVDCDCRLVLGTHIVLFSICLEILVTFMFANQLIMTLLQESTST